MFSERKQATIAVYEWLTEAKDEEFANLWLWAATPFPAGLPSDEQLDEGLRVATGELSLSDVLAKVEADMEEACRISRAAASL